jgi:hypothetical protein
MAAAEDDEWEYEYDETETEDFYITLDLSNIPERGNAAPKLGVKPTMSGHPIKLQSRLRELDAVRRYEETAVDPSGEGPSSMGAMQVTGLHTSNPLIVYDNRLVSCTWASTIGTDMFFVKPNPDAAPGEEPLRSLPAVDLLATSSAKLMGHVATLRPSDVVLEKLQLSEESTTVATGGPENGQPVLEDSQRPVAEQTQAEQIPAGPSRVPPNSFLSRLNEVKAKRGDKSILKVSDTPNGTRLVAEDVEMEGVDEQA